MSEWVTEWGIITKWACSAISWREKVIYRWDDDGVHFVLDKHTKSTSSLAKGCDPVLSSSHLAD